MGDWQPSPERFPGGIDEVTRRFREKGMMPEILIERLLYPTDLNVTMRRVEDSLVVHFPQVQMGCVVRL